MKRFSVWVVVIWTAISATTAIAAEDSRTQGPVVPAALESGLRLTINPDTEIFKRTVNIDGVIEDGEWDVFYTFSSGDWQATTYADWDWKNLYIGAKSNKPLELLCALDANDDGWFHGEENFEFKITRTPDANLSMEVSRYESRNVKTPTPTPVSSAEASLVEFKSGQVGEQHVIELRIPFQLIRNFKPAPGVKIGLQINVKTAPEGTDWVPTSLLGDVAHCTLVAKKFASLKPLVLGFDLKDTAVAHGETLVGRFHMTNSGTETLDVRSFVIAGEGKAGAYLSSERIRLEGLPPKKHIAHDTRTVIPTEMPVGSWALGAEVRSAEEKLGAALVSFDVVEPFETELRVPTGEVSANTSDVTIQVAVKNNTRKPARGKVKISLPVGWELAKNADTREFIVNPRGSVAYATFKAKPPIGELGKVPVKAEITIGGQTKTIESHFTVVAQ